MNFTIENYFAGLRDLLKDKRSTREDRDNIRVYLGVA